VGNSSRVLVACCNRLLRESIARLLAKKTDFEVSEAQVIGFGADEESLQSRTDVLVLDSLEFLLENRLLSPNSGDCKRLTRCVLVAMQEDQDHFLAAVRHGVLGYVLQEASAAEVVSTIQTVAQGQAVCPPSYARILFDLIAKHNWDLPNNIHRTKLGLTRRERQLIPMINEGLSNKEIASQLSLSEQTIKNHVHRILRKVGASNRLGILEACQFQAVNSHTKKQAALY